MIMIILLYAKPNSVHQTQVQLRHGVPLLGGLASPLHGAKPTQPRVSVCLEHSGFDICGLFCKFF